MSSLSFADACKDSNLFEPWFEGEIWSAWRVIAKALFGLPLDVDELAVFTQLTGRDETPTAPATEAWFIVGRRGGKDADAVAAAIAAYLATIGAKVYGYRARLTRGERGVVLVVDRDQERVCVGYVRALFEQPILAKLVLRDTADGL